MKALADGVWQLSSFPRDLVNAYLVEDVLIDACTRWHRNAIQCQLERRRVSLVALTHCHPDHQGCARMVCRQRGVPLACHEADVAVMEGRSPVVPRTGIVRLAARFAAGPPWCVERVLRDGDRVAGFRVVHAPGHTPGHVIYFREADRVAIAGDVLSNIHFITLKPGLLQPPPFFSVDAALNRQSIRLLLQLRPALICFGHGPPLRRLDVLEEFVARLP